MIIPGFQKQVTQLRVAHPPGAASPRESSGRWARGWSQVDGAERFCGFHGERGELEPR